MSPAVLRGFGYAVMTFAVLWLALAGACCVANLGRVPDLESALPVLGTLLVTSPLSFGPPLIALLVARSALRRARSEAGTRPRPNPAKGGIRMAIGVALAVVGLLFGVWIVEVALNTAVDPEMPFFMPLYGVVTVVHLGLVAVLMVVGGAWLAVTGARDSGLWRSRG